MSDCYELNVAGVTRQLPIIPISPELAIASFVILGDCELVTAAAPLLAQKLPKVDYLVTAEAKGIPLVHEVSRLLGLPYYIVARKSVKPYMAEPLVDEVVSITTQKAQTLCLDGKDALAVKGRRVAIVDDVISTGESLSAIERLLEKARYHFDAVLCESLDEAVKQAKANSRRGLLVCGSEAIALEAAKLLETI